MKISALLKKLAGMDPDEEVKAEDLAEEAKEEAKEDENVVEEVVEEKVEEQPVEEVKEEKTEEVIEEKPVEEQPKIEEAKEDSSAEVEALKAKIAEMESAKAEAESKIADLEKSNSDLAAAKDAADAKARIDSALQAGWLLPAMLKEADDKDSVFVDMARNHPELFDRLQLVMAPKALPKHGLTEAPADQSGAMTEDELVAKIKKLAADKGITYAQAAQMF